MCLATALGYDLSDNPPCAVSSVARVSFEFIRSYFEIKDRQRHTIDAAEVVKHNASNLPIKILGFTRNRS